MQYEHIGFRQNPFQPQAITAQNLNLYTGHCAKQLALDNALHGNTIVIIENEKSGLGSTSFGNFRRFTLHNEKRYFTPNSEIRVEPHWQAATLISAVLGNIISTLELQPHYHKIVANEAAFIETRSLVKQVTDTHRAGGANLLGVGASYDQSTSASQPPIICTQLLQPYFEGIVRLIQQIGFKHGVLIQLNNLNVGSVHQPHDLARLFHVMRDYFLTPGTSWFLIGDQPLRQFTQEHVERLAYCVAHETRLTPLTDEDFLTLIKRRIEHYRIDPHTELPVDPTVLLSLYHIAEGRMCRTFLLLDQLLSTVQIGVLCDYVTPALAAPFIHQYTHPPKTAILAEPMPYYSTGIPPRSSTILQ